MIRFLLLTTLMVSAGCTHTNVRKISSIDPTKKSISVPPGSKGLAGELKDYLRSTGWKLVVSTGDLIEKSEDAKTRITSEHKTKYVLYVNSTREDSCAGGGSMYLYEFSVIDTETGDEVLLLDGRDCSRRILKKFEAALN